SELTGSSNLLKTCHSFVTIYKPKSQRLWGRVDFFGFHLLLTRLTVTVKKTCLAHAFFMFVFKTLVA
ncbi:MAG: hypothetical protein ACREA3_10630, partial [Nitrosotalea sp.]